MRKYCYCLWVLILLAGCAGSPRIKCIPALKGSQIICPPQDVALPQAKLILPERETLTYSVRLFSVPVGSIISSIEGITNISGRDAYVLKAEFKPVGLASAVFKKEEKFISYLDTKTFCTLRHEVHILDHGRTVDVLFEFDQDNHKLQVTDLNSKRQKHDDLLAAAQDILSTWYYLMLVPAKIGDKFEFPVYREYENFKFLSLVDSNVLIKTPALGEDEREALLVHTTAVTLAGKKDDNIDMYGYFTCGPRKIFAYAKLKGPLFSGISILLTKIESSN